MLRKHTRTIAFILFFIFYSEFAGVLYASILSHTNNYKLFNGFDTGNFNTNKRATKKNNKLQPQLNTLALKDIKVKTTGLIEKKVEDDNSGPSQPEMATFKAAGVDNMVNLFTGDFSYNIPLLDVGGYPINLFYNGGITMDQDASWTGLGWNINPGTITRNMRGLPDDFDGTDKIAKTQKIRPEFTLGGSKPNGIELFGSDYSGALSKLTPGIFYNNYKGMGLEIGGTYAPKLNLAQNSTDEKTIGANFSMGFNLNSQEGLSLRPNFGVYLLGKDKEKKFGLQVGASYNSMYGVSSLQIDAETFKSSTQLKKDVSSSLYQRDGGHEGAIGTVSISFAKPSYTPSIRMPLSRKNFTLDLKYGKEDHGANKYNVDIRGYFSKSSIPAERETQVRPAYGYLNMEKGNNDRNALLDFNRINDNVFTAQTPIISLPYYTYDVFSISGEGTGGTFRAYRGDIGCVADPYTLTTSNNAAIGGEFASGNSFHAGVDFDYVNTPTTVGNWSSNNVARDQLKFQESNGLKEAVYFKNPGEKAIVSNSYFDAIGGDMISRLKLYDIGNTSQPLVIPALENFELQDLSGKSAKHLVSVQPVLASNTVRNTRDKRSQIITYLNAEEASRIGLDKDIYSYKENSFSSEIFCNLRTKISRFYENKGSEKYRRRNHISEIDVLEPDGKRYVYGIPVYNTIQKEVSFAVERPNAIPVNGIVQYSAVTDPTSPYYALPYLSDKTKDKFYQAEVVPAYAHSFLLTALLSPDYVDVTGNGITDDDLGDAIKFNYSRINSNASSTNNWSNYKWRTPFTGTANQAIYNEGLRTDKSDDRASYTFGERETWYMHSVESKNMVAVFHVSDREDSYQPIDELGNGSSVSNLKRLSRIDLYAKAELLKNNTNAKPIKSVFFVYDYSLCKGTPTNNNSHGKLTLKEVYFSYNGNDRQHKNKYVFDYGQNIEDNLGNKIYNPNYQRNSTDRWGTYKNPLNNNLSNNPANLSNTDYPFTLQSNNSGSTFNNQWASAWNLKKILLPSGSQIEVDYEADDYAYVQDRRATQMFQIAGFGKNSTASPSEFLAKIGSIGTKDQDYDYVFIDIPVSIASTFTTEAAQKARIKQLYLDGQKQLAFKLWIDVRSDLLSPSGVIDEPINIYADIDDWGKVSENRIWVKVKRLSDQSSPIMATVVQFLRNNLSSKAYPGSYVDPGANVSIQTVRSIVGMITRLTDVVASVDRKARMNSSLCSRLSQNDGSIKGFVRLVNPDFKKIGGGYRVKEVRIRDNWAKMKMLRNNSNTTVTIGDPANSVYGQHYYYTTTVNDFGAGDKEISSGVATYEPMIGAEENPFKEVLNYNNSSLPLGPTERGFIDMPLGETFFPSPMVGYSKVTVKSIHPNPTTTPVKKLKSGIGSQVTEFYTCKEFPCFSDFTSFDPTSNVRYKKDPILSFLKIDMDDMVTLSQGFRIKLNDMNGKMKSQSSYAENDDIKPMTYTEYFYKTKKIAADKYKLSNDNLKVVNKNGIISERTIGKDIEIMTDFREHRSITTSSGFQMNTDGFIIFTIPTIIPVWYKPPMSIINTYRSASVLKIINEYAILDKVVHIDKGSMVTTKNLVYDAETGETLVTETQNNYNNPLYSFNYPAYWAYPGMETAYKNIDFRLKNITFRNGIIEPKTQGEVDMNVFESGDEIYVYDEDNEPIANTRGCLNSGDPIFMEQMHEFKIWAIDISKDSRNGSRKIIFVDKNGVPFNSVGTDIRIVRSGKRNMLTASAGSLTSLSSPIVSSAILINNNTQVLNAGATEYKEKWKSEDGFYGVTQNTVTETYFPIHEITLTPPLLTPTSISHFLGTAEIKRHNSSGDMIPFFNSSDAYFEARSWDNGSNKDDYHAKSFALFDFSAVKKVKSAYLSLYSHTGNINTPGWSMYSLVHPDILSNHHYGFNPHFSGSTGNSQNDGGSNDFWISRIVSPLSDIINPNTPDRPYWFNTKTSLFSKVPVNLGTDNIQPNMNRWSVKSFCSFCGNGNDNRINITPIIKDMIYDRDINQKNYATGIGIDLMDRPWDKNSQSQERRVCFSSSVSGGLPPKIDVKYYDPAESTTIKPSQEYETIYSEAYQTTCNSYFDKNQMNPYQLGLLGNWRVSKNYVFYGDRKNNNPNTQTNIQTDGVINNFSPYWAFLSGDGGLAPSSGSQWVWNSQISQINKKGFEIENYDALMRFNSGIYGYNSTLPVAVVNNAKYREVGFDGFEDYNYSDRETTGICSDLCSEKRHNTSRHWKFENIDANITTEASHTGVSSIKVIPNHSFTFTNTVAANSVPADPDVMLELKDDEIPNMIQPVSPGTGLTGYYYNLPNWTGTGYAIRDNELPYLEYVADNSQGGFFGIRECNICCKQEFPRRTPIGINCANISAKWTGWIFIENTGDYDFAFQSVDDYGSVKLYEGNTSIMDFYQVWGQSQKIETTHLTQGFKRIEVDFSQNFGAAFIKLLWKTPTSHSLTPVPITVLYPSSVYTNSIPPNNQISIHCIKPGKIQGITNAKVDEFSLIQGSKMVLSTWVKVGSTDCQCKSYSGKASIQISFTGSGTMETIAPFVPAIEGNIIDGWQRLECVFDVPSTATGMTANINNLTGNNLYFDDLRIHPFNSNMKSFVYHPVTLRLMAELDENNYASFYEYDNDGTLTRVKKETKEGIKTIKETRSALQKGIQEIQN